jgi:hypothetical protein
MAITSKASGSALNAVKATVDVLSNAKRNSRKSN